MKYAINRNIISNFESICIFNTSNRDDKGSVKHERLLMQSSKMFTQQRKSSFSQNMFFDNVMK